ncbi:Protein F13G3.3 b, partial [Aphelenchoides avenae]
QAAEFIIITDLDDFLFPSDGHWYIRQFRHLASKYPEAAGFSYNRYNAKFTTTRLSGEYRISDLLKTTLITTDRAARKSVVRPSRVRTVWIHWPGIIEPGYKMQSVPEKINIMVHLRQWRSVDNYNGSIPEPHKKLLQRTEQ